MDIAGPSFLNSNKHFQRWTSPENFPNSCNKLKRTSINIQLYRQINNWVKII